MKKELTLNQQLLKGMLEDSLTKSEILSSHKKIIDLEKKRKADTLAEIKAMKDLIYKALNNVKNDTSTSFNTEKSILTGLVNKMLKNAEISLSEKIADVEFAISQIKNGKDADEDLIVDKLAKKIKIPTIEELKKDLPIMGEEVRNALELLQGNERLDWTAIKGLRSLINKLAKENISMGGGLRPAGTGIEELSGTINGVNKTFTVTWVPEYITINGQNVYVDNGYTLASSSGVLTIILENAPETGDIVRSHYKEV